MLIYKPLPVDDVTLTEPERCERQSALDKQCHCIARPERELQDEVIKRKLKHKSEPLTSLIESDDESDDDSLYEKDIVFESRGGEVTTSNSTKKRQKPK